MGVFFVPLIGVSSIMGKPLIPGLPHHLPEGWEPHPKQLEAIYRLVTPEELPPIILAFREFCKKNHLKRARWGHLFAQYLKCRHDPNWVPKHQED